MATSADERTDNESLKFGGTQPDKIHVKVSEIDANGVQINSPGRSKSYADTSFLTGDSPVTIDVNTDLGRNATDGTILNDGPGNILVEISNNGTDFGDSITLTDCDELVLKNFNVNKIRLTWVSDSSYRILVI